MMQEEKEWTPLPRPCLVCLTKKKVDHSNDDTKPSRPTMTLTDAEFISNQTDIINTFTDNLVNINKDNSDQLEQCGDMTTVNIMNVGKTQKCLSLKRAANFTNQKHHSSAKNVCNKKTLNMNSKVKQQDLLLHQQTFKPVLTDQVKTQSKWQPTLFGQSSIAKFDTKKQKELAIQSTSKQASNLSLFQKRCSANKIVEQSKTDDGLKLCPLCQMEFLISWTQIEKDGHIASCLSETSDDVIW
ncbi:uncharacterized protein [Antedon mediterranea]|uniref:uncharacterized protein n=1 Tax=Antedon mediterranea TaxID=105859 RepID=UPI003AF89AF3